jgi:hypothetical protein
MAPLIGAERDLTLTRCAAVGTVRDTHMNQLNYFRRPA